MATSETEQTYIIGNMDCANCAREVEDGVAKLDGVNTVKVDFMAGTMRLDGDVPFAALKARVEALGKTIDAPSAEKPAEGVAPERGGVLGFWDYLLSRSDTRLAVIGGALVLLTLLASLLGLPETIAAGLYVGGMLLTLWPIARSGLNALWINRQFNINLLMSIAAVGAVVLGEYLEAATVIFLFAVGEALEGYTVNRARQGVTALMAIQPRTATLADGLRVPVESLRVGDRIVVRPGEQIPMDGTVLAGESGVNQAPITGESVPVSKASGDAVFAGSINGDGALEVEVTALAANNTLSRIVRLVTEAQSAQAPSQRLVDRFAAWYTPAVVVLAALTATLPALLFGQPFFDTAGGHGWLYRALVMLVIACPCALVISTPVTVISAITAATRRGVLIKGGAALEALGQVRVLAFDKTGTLTEGRPAVTAVHALDCTGEARCEPCDDLLALASAVERRAAHPLADAVYAAAHGRGLDERYATAEAISALPGRGVQGVVNGRTVTLGSHRYFDERFPHNTALCDEVRGVEAAGQTTMLLADDDDVRGYIALADTPREHSAHVLAELSAMGQHSVMLTGDNPAVAAAVAGIVGVDDFRAGLLPEDKVRAVETLRATHGSVAMVGDGINDTPALAAATVGIAMGGAGSPQALETADIALMADDLQQLPVAIRLARFARRLIGQNIALSLAVKAVFLVLAVAGLSSLWLAIFADMGMSLLVTLNGTRPLRFYD